MSEEVQDTQEPEVGMPPPNAAPEATEGRPAVTSEAREPPAVPGASSPLDPRAVRETKQWRKDLDLILQKMKGDQLRTSRERSIAVTKLQECMMWLGMDLKAMAGGVSCYTHGKDPDSPLVEPTADGLTM